MVNATVDKRGYINIGEFKFSKSDDKSKSQYDISSFRKIRVHEGKFLNIHSVTRHIIRGTNHIDILALERRHEDRQYRTNEVDFYIKIAHPTRKVVIPWKTYLENKEDERVPFMGMDTITEIGEILRLHENVYSRREFKAIAEKDQFQKINPVIGSPYGNPATPESNALLAKSKEIDNRREDAAYVYDILRKVIDTIAFPITKGYVNTVKPPEIGYELGTEY